MAGLIGIIRLLQPGDFTKAAQPISDTGGQGRVSAASITAHPAVPDCVVKEMHVFLQPGFWGLDSAGVRRQAQQLTLTLNAWAAMPLHPNVLPLLGVGCGSVHLQFPHAAEVPDVPLFVFSPRHQMTLKTWLEIAGDTLSDEALARKLQRIVQQIAAGLAHLHAHGVVHGDLKLENIFCNADATDVVVGDLGLITPDAYASVNGPITGNPIHMAPEMGAINTPGGVLQSQYSVGADVWSFGMLLFEMLFILRNDELEGFVCNTFARVVRFDANHRADTQLTAQEQNRMRTVVNDRLAQRHPQCIQELFAMRTRQDSGEASSVMEVALQLNRRLRGSMEQCLALLELSQSRQANAAQRQAIAELEDARRLEQQAGDEVRRDAQATIQAKDRAIQAKDTELAALQAELQRLRQAQLAVPAGAPSAASIQAPPAAGGPGGSLAQAAAAAPPAAHRVDPTVQQPTPPGDAGVVYDVDVAWTKGDLQQEMQAKGWHKGQTVRLTNTRGLAKIGDAAVFAVFGGRSSLAELLDPTRIVMDASMQAVVEVGDRFLVGCSALKELDLAPLSKVVEVGNWFLHGCSALKELDLAPLSKVEKVGGYFLYGCSALKELDLAPLSKVEKVGDHFLAGCSALKAVSISNQQRGVFEAQLNDRGITPRVVA